MRLDPMDPDELLAALRRANAAERRRPEVRDAAERSAGHEWDHLFHLRRGRSRAEYVWARAPDLESENEPDEQ